jgi:glycosyltransferase involved in cell wall biosynthesis
MAHLSIVIPLLNEESLIHELVSRVKFNATKITEDFEIILVDDGSNDSTWEKIKIQGKIEKRVKGVKFSRNFGHHYAITAGLEYSKGDWVVVMDGDLQDRPEVITDLYMKAQEGFDVVFVSRVNRPEGLIYKLAQKTFYLLLRILSGIKYDSSFANFSIISKQVVNSFTRFTENTRFYSTTVDWLGFKRTSIEASHGHRHSGKSSYSFNKRLKLAVDIIISFSERPLHLAILFGLLTSLFSIFTFLWIIIGAFRYEFTVLGWPSIMVAILFMGGMILTVIGILGIYIGRIYREVKYRPLYIVKEILD